MSSLLEKSIPVNMAFYMFDHADNMELLLKLIKELNVGIIGISLFSTRRQEFYGLAAQLKKTFSDIAIVCGGPDVNSNYLNVVDWADYLCLADGEIAFPNLCAEILHKNNKQNIQIPNIFYKTKNEIVRNSIEIEKNLDKYRFPYFSDEKIFLLSSGHLTSHKDSLSKVYNIYASRGCPYKCTYCANHVFSRVFPHGINYRYRSVENVINEITTIISKMPNIKSITFHDEQFGANNRWFEEFVIKYKNHVNMPFFVQMNPKEISKEKTKQLIDIGLVSMSFGMQSASERTRKLYSRPENLDQIKHANQILHELKVTHFFDVLTDNPYENHEDIEETLKFLLSLKKPFVAKTFDLVHLPNTLLTEMLLKDDKITVNQIEGNFKYDKEVEWRVKENNLTMNIDEKYLVALIQMTGNILYPNILVKALMRSRKRVPKFFKKTIAKVVLTAQFYKSQMLINAAVSLAQKKQYRVLFKKVAGKIIKSL